MGNYKYRILLKLYKWMPFKQLICNAIKRYRRDHSKYYLDLRFKGRMKVKIDSTHSFFIYNPGYTTIENEIYWHGLFGGWERGSLEIWAKLCNNAKVIFDVGANTGVYSLMAKSINRSADVYSFEPSKRVFEKLKHNVEINDFDIQLFPMAVSNKPGESFFNDTFDKHQYSASLSEEMRNLLLAQGVTINTYSVATNSIDNFVLDKKISKIDLIKIDVELHEPEVMEGMLDTLTKHRPDIVIEILNDEIAEQIERNLPRDIYSYYYISDEGLLVRMKKLSAMKPYNYLICKKTTEEFLNLH